MMLIIAGLAIERKDFEIEIIARNRELSLSQAERTLEGRLNRTTERALRDICILYPPKWMNSKRRKTVKGGVGGRGDFGHELADKFATFWRIQASQKRILREQ